MSGKTFKILAIDGGGIKGLYSSKILEHFEERYDCLISEYFDLICGTSTGGLIALAISVGIPSKEISKIYSENGKYIFPSQKWRLKTLKQIFGGIYSNKGLIKVLDDLFKDKTIKDCNNLICIPSFNITESKPIVFKNDHSEGLNMHDNLLLKDVALATSAAPTYLPVWQINSMNSNQYIDGGIWANNPSLVGYLEALKYFVGKGYDSIELLSISNLNIPNGVPIGAKRRKGFYSWKSDLFNTSLIGQSYFNDFFMQTIQNHSNVPTKYFRIGQPSISKNHLKYIDMDLTTEKSIQTLKTLGDLMGNNMKNHIDIKHFFSNKKTYKNG